MGKEKDEVTSQDQEVSNEEKETQSSQEQQSPPPVTELPWGCDHC